MTEHSLMILFSAMQEQENPPVLELLNKDHEPVGAIYLDKLKYKNFVISETNNSEKYYFYVNGLGIYFSYYQKISL
jgi:hypothetical protein